MRKKELTDEQKEYIRLNAATHTITEMLEPLKLVYSTLLRYLKDHNIPYKKERIINPLSNEAKEYILKNYRVKNIVEMAAHLKEQYARVFLFIQKNGLVDVVKQRGEKKERVSEYFNADEFYY